MKRQRRSQPPPLPPRNNFRGRIGARTHLHNSSARRRSDAIIRGAYARARAGGRPAPPVRRLTPKNHWVRSSSVQLFDARRAELHARGRGRSHYLLEPAPLITPPAGHELINLLRPEFPDAEHGNLTAIYCGLLFLAFMITGFVWKSGREFCTRR